jgi:hypothetical protein
MPYNPFPSILVLFKDRTNRGCDMYVSYKCDLHHLLYTPGLDLPHLFITWLGLTTYGIRGGVIGDAGLILVMHAAGVSGPGVTLVPT